MAPDLPVERLHLDHVGAEVGEQAAAHRSRPGGGRLEDAHAVEGAAEVAPGVPEEVLSIQAVSRR